MSSMANTSSSPPPDSSRASDVFASLQAYPFHTDLEFRSGLSIILGHPETPATDAEVDAESDLVLQAKCFFFSRKAELTPPLSSAEYKVWLESERARKPTQYVEATTETAQEPDASPSKSVSSNAGLPGDGASAHAEEPAYPSSFAHIVELITTGQPVPGIQPIPDTVLAGHDTSSAKPRRRKPWELNENTPGEDTTGDTRNVAPV